MPRASTSRDRMIQTAAQLLWSQGFNATGLNQILEQSDTPKGSLYFHFPGGKEQLAVEALRSAGVLVTNEIARRLDRHDNVADGIADFVGAFARFLRRSNFERGCPAATVTLETSAKSEALREACLEIYDRWQAILAARLEAAGKEPERASALATLILSAVEGAMILSRARRSTQPLEAVADELVRLVR